MQHRARPRGDRGRCRARSGKRLFGVGTIPAGLRLIDNAVSKTGVTITTYERAGDIGYGSFALEEPTEAELERRRRLTHG